MVVSFRVMDERQARLLISYAATRFGRWLFRSCENDCVTAALLLIAVA